jgi:predicted PurR-regulated permease PerM
MNRHQLENISLGTFAIGVSIVLFFIFQPFIKTLLLAAVLALLLSKPYERLVRILYGKRGLISLLIVLLTLVFIIAPLFFFGTQIFQEVQIVYGKILSNQGHYLQVLQDKIEQPIRHLFPSATVNIQAYLVNILGFVSNNLAGILSQTLSVFFNTFLMLLALFFFLQDGRTMVSEVKSFSPFKREHTDGIVAQIYIAVSSVIRGTIFVALIRWVIVSIAFYIFGISNALLWGSIGGMVGAIPGLGTSLVFIPAIFFLYTQGNITGAVGLIFVGIITVILVDNMLSGYYFHKGLKTSPLFILFSIFGGITVFGPVGLILGPLVLSVFLSLVGTYRTLVIEREA